jgi:hypothetical protein
VAGQDLGEGAFAASVPAHQGVNLSGPDGEVDTMKNGLLVDPGVEILDLKQDGGIWADHGGLSGAGGERGMAKGGSTDRTF